MNAPWSRRRSIASLGERPRGHFFRHEESQQLARCGQHLFTGDCLRGVQPLRVQPAQVVVVVGDHHAVDALFPASVQQALWVQQAVLRVVCVAVKFNA